MFEGRAKPAGEDAPGEQAISRLEVTEAKVKRILVGVDFSEGSREALEYATALAKKLEAEIVVLHVFEGVPGELKILEAAYVGTSFRQEAERNLAEWTRELRVAGVAGRAEVREAAAADREIIGVANEKKVDLIVIGRHGRQGVERMFTSNTAAKVLRHAPCAVLVV